MQSRTTKIQGAVKEYRAYSCSKKIHASSQKYRKHKKKPLDTRKDNRMSTFNTHETSQAMNMHKQNRGI